MSEVFFCDLHSINCPGISHVHSIANETTGANWCEIGRNWWPWLGCRGVRCSQHYTVLRAGSSTRALSVPCCLFWWSPSPGCVVIAVIRDQSTSGGTLLFFVFLFFHYSFLARGEMVYLTRWTLCTDHLPPSVPPWTGISFLPFHDGCHTVSHLQQPSESLLGLLSFVDLLLQSE